MDRKYFLVIGVFVAVLAVFAIFKKPSPTSLTTRNLNVEEGVKSPEITSNGEGPDIEIVAQNLEIPWEIAFLPSGGMLVTERPGRLLKIGQDKKVYEIAGVHHVGEGGLLGLALHPNFESNSLIYLYLTSTNNGEVVNRVERYKLENDALTNREVILEGIGGASNHDGGRIKFGPSYAEASEGKPDYFLFITTGDAQNSKLSQDTNSLNGKILRVTADGEIPTDNPFGNAVYSYGHRNVQGIAWDSGGRLWATEHGRSGVLSGLDELNLIEKGKNYGWPDIQGDETRAGMVSPIIHSGASETWAPSGAEFLPAQAGFNGSIFFAGLRGETLYEARLDNVRVSKLVKHLSGEYGRLRTVRLGPDGYLYILTSNRDGRGEPKPGDDKIIRFNPAIFQ